jgi:small subunit ribosomal protein S3
MAQKVHPHALRLAAHTRHFDHVWYSDHFYGTLLVQDLRLRQALVKVTEALHLPRARTSLQMSAQGTRLALCLCLPGAMTRRVIPQKSTPFLAHLAQQMAGSGGVEMMPLWTPSVWQDAHYVVDEIRRLLERRMSFRRIQRLFLRSLAASPRLLGLRVVCAGRVGGKSKKAQRARRDIFQCGQTSLHTLATHLDFAQGTANTPLGAMGVKVWMHYRPMTP